MTTISSRHARHALRAAAVLLLLAFAACAMAPVHTSALRIQPTRPMVAKKIERPLFLVLDPAQVPDEYTIPEATIKEIQILEIRQFVRRDLRAALETFFDRVEVVPPTMPIPGDALVAQVQIQGFASEADMVTTGVATATRVYGRMSWAFAIRQSAGTEFAFSHSESVTGTFPLTNVNQTGEMMESTYRLALEHLITNLSQPDVLARLGAAPAVTAQP